MTEPDEVHTMLCRGGYTSCDENIHHERKPVRRFGWGHLMALVIIGTLIWCAGLFLTGSRAAEPEPDCAWVGTHQRGAQTCRDRGWVLTVWLAVNPHGVVSARNYLPACTFEDGSGGPLPCSWNLNEPTENGRGLAYWIGKDRRTHYVWSKRPAPIRHGTAHWSTRSERHRFDLARSCWVTHPAPHRWKYQCPDDGAPA